VSDLVQKAKCCKYHAKVQDVASIVPQIRAKMTIHKPLKNKELQDAAKTVPIPVQKKN